MIIRYIKNSILDYILCLFMAVALAYNVAQGFKLPAELSSQLSGYSLLAIPVLLFLFAAAYNKKTVIAFSGLGICIIVAFIVISGNMGISLVESINEEQNIGAWIVIATICIILLFLLSRTWQGTFLLFIIAVISMAVLNFLQYAFSYTMFFVLLIGTAVMFIYKRYHKMVVTGSVQKTAFGMQFLTALILCTLAGVMAGGIWYFIIRPINPPTMDLKLIEKMYSVEVLERLGISSTQYVVDNNLISNKDNQQNQQSSQQNNQNGNPDDANNNENNQNDNQNSDNNNGDNSNTKGQAIELPDTFSNMADSISYEKKNIPWIIIGIILIVLLTVGLILSRRKIWLNKMLAYSKEEQIARFYRWYLKKFKVLGADGRGSDTPYEYSDRIAAKMEYLRVNDIGFKELTDIFVRTFYGGEEVSEEDYQKYREFYQKFYKNCRKRLGIRYLWKYFRL